MTGMHPIQVVARRTGLSPDVLRAWEKRYAAVEPTRSPTGRRLYTDGDVERLLLLRRATLSGRSIGQIAGLSDAELRDLVAEDEDQEARAPRPRSATAALAPARPAAEVLETCIEAIRSLDGDRLDATLSQAEVQLSPQLLLDQVLGPLMESIGEHWNAGELRVTHEHLASSVVRSFLGRIRQSEISVASGPRILVTTPAGQIHELGAALAGAAAALEGWRVTYLGPNVPAAEVAAAAAQLQPRAVALSIVYPTDDPHVLEELRRLREFLPDEVAILIGGAAAPSYLPALEPLDLVHLPDLPALRAWLRDVRKP